MNQVQLFTSGVFGSVRAVVIDEKAWFVANDVATSLGYAKPNNAVNMHCKGVVKQGITHPHSNKRIMEVNVIDECDVIRLVEKSRTITPLQKQDFLMSLNIKRENYVLISSSKETEFLSVLEEQLKVFGLSKFERQYSKLKCGNYKIDLYLPEINVAVEYDENGHKHYTYEQQELRQQLIEEELGCKFIRVTENESHIVNSAIVIKEIAKLIF